MKKNLLSIIILALLVVNIALTGIMMVSMMGTNKKTADLVSDIAAVLNLELGVDEEEEEKEIPMSQQYIWNMEEKMTIQLQSEELYDEAGNYKGVKDHFLVFNVSFILDTKGDGYKEFGGENFANYETVIRDAITVTASKHTIDDCRNDFESMREEMLQAVKALFEEEFIYKIAINNMKYE